MLDITFVFFQIINVNSTTPCFLNVTAGAEVFKNCGFTTDYLRFMVLPWEWITGGNFSLVLVSVIVMFSYIKYQKVIYPILLGFILLPTAVILFPTPFLNIAFVLVGLGIGFMVIYIMLRQTNTFG